MSGIDRLDRDLAVWFEETAVPRVPDYVDEIVKEAVRGRQRPRWTFVSRWLPARVAGLALPSFPIRWRTVAILAALLALLVAGAVFVGSRPRVPPPFGLAANGLFAYDSGGDIFVFDPIERTSVPLVQGAATDHHPAWSRDGMKLAFIRSEGDSDRIVFVGRDGHDEVVSTEMYGVDPDSIAWSPTGDRLAVRAGSAVQSLYIVGAADGTVTRLNIPSPELEPYWRPPDGRELMIARSGPAPGLYRYVLDSEALVLVEPGHPDQLRPDGWSPTGDRFIFRRTIADEIPFQSVVRDLTSNTATTIDAGALKFSNSGARIAGYRVEGPITRLEPTLVLCEVVIASGECRPIEAPPHEPDLVSFRALAWSPDDEWLQITPRHGGGTILVDPDGIEDPVTIPSANAGTYQRLAP